MGVSRVDARRSLMKPMPVSQRIVHERYGFGTITEADTEYTTIEFDLHGRKKFVTNMVMLQPSDEPAPPKRKGVRRSKKV
jgi:hypothetical protein